MSLATLTTQISRRLQKLSELFGAGRAPAGYRPGITLEYLRRNLGLTSFALTEGGRATFCLELSTFRSTWSSAPSRSC